MDPNPDLSAPTPTPAAPLWRHILAFILVSAAWGLTTPFMRRAAVASTLYSTSPAGRARAEARKWVERESALRRKVWGLVFAVGDTVRNPGYAVPLVVNLTGSVWFFLLVGQAELSLTVPIVNSLAFLFTVLGEWYADGKVIERETWLGMSFVLGGIALCVHAKQ